MTPDLEALRQEREAALKTLATLESRISEALLAPNPITDACAHLPESLDAKQAAELLRIPVSSVYSKSAAGIIPRRMIGGSVKFSKRRLLLWLAGQDESEESEDSSSSGKPNLRLVKNSKR